MMGVTEADLEDARESRAEDETLMPQTALLPASPPSTTHIRLDQSA
jgi:hypothetical protein